MSDSNCTRTGRNDTYPTINPKRAELSAEGKTVIVAGGFCQQLETSIALSFANAGATRIALLGPNESPLNTAESELASRFTELHVQKYTANFSKTESMGLAAHEIRVDLGAWDVFVLCRVQHAPSTPLTAADTDDWWVPFETGPRAIQLFAKHFLAKASPGASFMAVVPEGSIRRTGSAGSRISSADSAASLAVMRLCEIMAHETEKLRVFGVCSDLRWRAAATEDDEISQVSTPSDQLTADFLVWCASPEAEFLRSKIVSSSWDVRELMQRKAEIEHDPDLFRIKIGGYA